MEYENSSNDSFVSFNEKNNIQLSAFQLKNNNNKNYTKNRLFIKISHLFINKLKKEDYIEIIKFIMNSCDLILKNNFYYKNDIFKIKKKKVKKENYFYYKLLLTREKRNRIRKEKENYFLKGHKEIKKIKFEEKNKGKNIHNSIDINEEKDNEMINEINDNDYIKEDINNYYYIKDGKFYCVFHKRRFKDKKSFYNHFKSLHKYKCLKCSRMFPSIIDTEKHLKYCYVTNDKRTKLNNVDNYNINSGNKTSSNQIKKEDSKILDKHDDIKINTKDNKIEENEIKNQKSFKENLNIKTEKEPYIDDNIKIKQEYHYQEQNFNISKYLVEEKDTNDFEKYFNGEFRFFCDDSYDTFENFFK